uniref:histidine kinase n=2 Tax=Natrinema halophilum TaxID=1699371 RepID=A0A7D5KFW2_9EURY
MAQAIYAIAAVTALLVCSIIFRHREKKGAVWLAVFMFASAVWAGSLFLATIVDSFALSVFFRKSIYFGVGPVVASMLLFALEYSGRERFVRPEIVGLLSIEPILVIVLAYVNPRDFFFATVEPDPTVPSGVIIDIGLGFVLHTVYSYVLLTAFSLMIVEMLYNSKSLYRGQSGGLLVGTAFTWAMNVLTVFSSAEVDLTPIGFIVGGTLYSVAIIRYRLTDIVPIARDRVLDHVSDGVFVLDRDDRLIDVNPVGRTLLEDIESSPIGENIGSLFSDYPRLHDEYQTLTAAPTDGEREFKLDDNHFHARTTPIDDGRDRHVGWLLIVRDITDRKRREAQLKRQNERLERFADVVSHDLRNPLNVADGYLELAYEADDPESHLHKIEQSHDRMEAIIEDVLALAREGDEVSDPEPVTLAELAEQAWETVDSGDATLTVASDERFLADPGRTRRLLENLFRNAIEHGMSNNGDPSEAGEQGQQTDHDSGSEIESGADDTAFAYSGDVTADSDPSALNVSVGNIDSEEKSGQTGFYVADDGRGLPDDRDQVFEDGYTTNEDGTGFGLSIVHGIATAHDWEVDATDSETGGARFEFTGVEPVTEAVSESSAIDPDIESGSPP